MGQGVCKAPQVGGCRDDFGVSQKRRAGLQQDYRTIREAWALSGLRGAYPTSPRRRLHRSRECEPADFVPLKGEISKMAFEGVLKGV